MESSEGRDTLGIALAPDGSMTDEMKLLQKKTGQCVSTIRTRLLPSGEIMLGMSSTIMKTIEYPLCATTFSREETNRLVKPIHDLILPLCKLCRKIPLSLRCGPKDSLGLGLHDVFITQGIEKVSLWIEEHASDSLTGPILRDNYEASIIHVRIGGKKLFSLEHETLGSLLPQLCIKSLWRFSYQFGIKLPGTAHDLDLAREGDNFLMESFACHFPKKQLVILNRCRLYLKVCRLSDIVDGTGEQITLVSYKGLRNCQRVSRLD